MGFGREGQLGSGNAVYVFTGNKEDVIENQATWHLMKPMKKLELHHAVEETFPEVVFCTGAGSKPNSPIEKFVGLRPRTPMEKLALADVLLSVGTKFESESLEGILQRPVEVSGASSSLFDIERLVVGISDNKRNIVVLVEPTSR